MDSNIVYKGSHCDATVDDERVQDMVHEHYGGVSKYTKDAKNKFTLRTCFPLCSRVEPAQGAITKRRKKMENRKVLVEMLLQSDKILQKTSRLQE